jgi:hypothetical protein
VSVEALFDRLWRLLRSRRLAVSLIAFLGVFSIAATFVPRGTPQDPAVHAWALANPVLEAVVGPLGLHRAYASPLFLVFAALLSANLEERLHNRPQARTTLSVEIDPQAALDATATGLRRLGLRVRRGPSLVEGLSGAWGAFGSPMFHWSIVALMLVAAAGQATRAEGFMGLPVGERVADVRANYLQITEGPLFGERFTGVEFQAEDVVRNYTLGNVDYGPSPIVTAFRDGTQVASGRVYPNSPLRVGSLLVHMADFGPAATLALESAGGPEVGRHTVMLDRSTETSSGTGPREFSFVGGTDALPIDARVQVVVIRTPAGATPTPQASRAIVETATAGSGTFGPPVTLAVAEFMPLPGGARLRLADVKDSMFCSASRRSPLRSRSSCPPGEPV